MLAFYTLFLLLSFIIVGTKADYTFTSPAAGQTFAASSPITIKFEDDGGIPAMTEITSTQVLLCTGSNSAISCFSDNLVGTFTPSESKTSYEANLASLTSLGSNGRYFFQFYSVGSGGTTIHYTERFTLTGMTGTTKATDGGDTTPPTGSNSFNTGNDDDSVITKSNTIPYLSQTGRIRYAPMQMQPGSKVTHALTASRRFPTSSVTYFTDYTLRAYAITTKTPSWSYTISQAPNWVATLPSPTGYYAASEALKRTINAKSKRGYVDL
ncbi:hypothetical protein D0Z00_001518 [Geotrichum galactomycetum]|uniref:Uncharacterized protein n=1 Tax=Geotrichum galactomycetum TaxID=27317 RepID=A0ACB6V6U5_9ASCO|nr:hypothetical protein D0Z00_001518 [Geotrichum candidum]